jgi:hypothetical protein
MKKIKYVTGDKIGNLTFIKDGDPHISPSRKSRTGLFRCKCGNEFTAIIRSVITGNTKSCGCYGRKSRSERFKKHGLRNHKLYSTWQSMKTRCYNKKRADYKYYGGRGITVSEEFRSDFLVWFNYVTSLPNYENREKLNLTIDRVDNNKNYERGNLRWATKKQQVKNSRY